MGFLRVLRSVKLPAAALTLLALVTAAPALADDTELGAVGSTVVASPAADIRLAAETVQATCFGSFAEFRVDFRFVNDGKARRVRLGFPFSTAVADQHGTERPFGFQAWQGSHPLGVKIVTVGGSGHAGSPRGYFVHTARFPHGDTTITVSYLAQQSSSARGRAKDGDIRTGAAAWYEYWLHTGRTWKGPIGAAVVRFSLADTFPGRGVGLTAAQAGDSVPVTTAGWTSPAPRSYEWRLLDFEPPASLGDWWRPQPASDITLGFSHDVSAKRGSAWTSSHDAQSPAGGRRSGAIADGQLDTAWIAGPLREGDRPWVQGTFTQRHIRELRILTGANAFTSAFARYGRPKTLTATFSDGTSVKLRLTDAPVLQRFTVDVVARSVRLTVDDVYPGDDYPSVAIAEVEVGAWRAPGYAEFDALLAGGAAPGRLAAWAGLVGGRLRAGAGAEERQEREDAAATGCDLIAIDYSSGDPAAAAPFRQASSLAAMAAANARATLPPESLVGRVLSVDSLSRRTWDIRYSSGIELLVDTRAGEGAGTVLAELNAESGSAPDLSDGRRLPFELRSIGRGVVGVFRAGHVSAESSYNCEEVDLPAQVFWRHGTVAYHLYARSKDVSVADLTRVAQSLLVPHRADIVAAGEAHGQAPAGRARTWGPLLAAALVAVALVLLRLSPRLRAERRHP